MTVRYDRLFCGEDSSHVDAAAHILVAAFKDRSPAWPTFAAGHATVSEFVDSPHISYGAFLDNELIGWVGATPSYNGQSWEIQLLGVSPQWQRRGIATSLLKLLSEAVQRNGGHTLFVWCDDESESTTIGGKDIFTTPLEAIQAHVSGPRHAGGFYEQFGFVRCGILPNANGLGKPDILYAMAIGLTPS